MAQETAEQRALRRLREAKTRFGRDLLELPSVHGIGIGRKRVNGQKTDNLAIIVHVYNKVPEHRLEPSERIPAKLRFVSTREGREISVLTDVREVAPPRPEVECGACRADFESKTRPTPGGYSIGLVDEAGGTLGGWVWDDLNDEIVLICNEHVLGSDTGTTVIQPSALDGGASPADNLAEVVRAGTLDVAIARPDDADDLQIEIECSTPAVYEIADAEIDTEVEKVGQTTGLTCGIVDLIDYDSSWYGSRNDLWIDGDGSDFSMGGDSGSLYVERQHPDGHSWKRIVGIHWGGSGNDGVGHPIRAVFEDANLTTVCSGIIQALVEAFFGAAGAEAEVEIEVEPERMRAPQRRGPWPRRTSLKLGLARDVEARFRETAVGSRIADLLHANRVSIVKTLLTGDGWRATRALLAPIMATAVTTDDVLDHVLSENDRANAQRLVKVLRRVAPELDEAVEFGDRLLTGSVGRRIGDVLASKPPRQRRKSQKPEPN